MPLLKYYDTVTSQWLPILAGAKGETGDVGPIGPQGPAGLGSVAVTSPITNSGTSTAAVIGINQTALSLDAARITSGRFASARMPAGSIIQVVSTTKSDTFAASSFGASLTNITGLTATITPSSASSQILVQVMLAGVSASQDGTSFVLLRDSSAIGIGDASGSRQRRSVGAVPLGGYNHTALPITFLDSPGTTAARTYGVSISNALAGVTTTVLINRTATDGDAGSVPRYISSITLFEVAR